MRTIIIALFLQLSISAASQPELLYAHFSQPFYTAGDDIRTAVYFLREDTAEIRSRVVYVEVWSPDGSLLLQERLKRTGNRATWSYRIPFDLEGGIYTCRFYTLWNLNFSPKVVYATSFRLLAGSGQGGPAPDFSDWNPRQMVVGQLPLQIDVSPEQEVYNTGDTVRIYVQTSDRSGDPVACSISVSVTDDAWIPPFLATRANLRSAITAYDNLGPEFEQMFAPETGLRVEGMVFESDGTTPLETSYLSLHLVESNAYIQSRTEKGYYRYDLDDFYGRQNAQIHNLNPFQPPLPVIRPLDPASLIPPDAGISQEAARPDSLVVNRYLFLMRQQRRFRELFDQPALSARTVFEREPAIGQADRVYDMADYEKLESVAEFLDEIILTARLEEDDQKRNVFLLNSLTRDRFPRPAWFQVDGFLISDATYALSIPFLSVEEISVYTSPATISAHFPSVLSSFGVIGIRTRDGSPPAGLEDVSNRFGVPGYHLPQKFQAPEKGRAPDFRPLVYWSSDLQTDASGRAYFEFITTDGRGTFTIHVEGVSQEGDAGTGYARYRTGE